MLYNEAMLLLYYLIAVNLAAFILYGADKSYAKKNKRRIPERNLLFWAWIGGSLGAFLGMRIFHHKTKKPKFAIPVPILAVLEVICIVFCLFQNYHLTVTDYDVDLDLGHDLKIVQVSDLHNQIFGIKESKLISKIEQLDPDIIVVTGDVVDKVHTSYDIALDFFEGATKIAPVYYITGNHENILQGSKKDAFMEDIRALGVIFLDDTFIENDDYILAGVSNASVNKTLTSIDTFEAYAPFDDSKPVILLTHKPQFTEFYDYLGSDLVLAGHYHGGQIILPGGHALISPEVEFFPEMYEGLNDINGMKLILSRGLGNSVFPVRINNYPELVVVNVH